MIGLPELQNTSPEMRLDMIKLAVLKIMQMNNALYIHLHSYTFDVPDYEKDNIVYNNETLSIEFEEYFCHGLYNQDFKFHQKLLEVQIMCNRRIRQNVRECREMYADRHNPLYSRKKYKTREIFPDAVEQNLPELLPMTHLCDHLLTAFHYVHDPQIALVMDFIVGGGNRSSVTPGVQVMLPHSSSTVPGGFNPELPCMIQKETRGMAASVEIPSNLRPAKTTAPVLPIDMTRQIRAVEFPGHVLPVEIPQPVSFFQKSRHETPKPCNLLDQPKHQSLKPTRNSEKPQKVIPAEAPTPAKPVEKTKVICESDLVGQILMQGLNTSKTQFPSLLPGSSVTSVARPEKTLTTSVRSTETKPSNVSTKSFKGNTTSEVIKPQESKTTTKYKVFSTKPACDVKNVNTIVPKTKVAWDVNKVLGQKSTVTEKRPRDPLADNVKDEMEAKRQRMTQWLHDHISGYKQFFTLT